MLPRFGAEVCAQQVGQGLLTGLLLLAQAGQLLLRGLQLLLAIELAVLLLVQGQLALLLFLLLLVLLFQLFAALQHLLVKLHKGRRGLTAQPLKHGGRQQLAEACELFVQALAIGV